MNWFKSCTKCGMTMPVCFGHFYRQTATSDGYGSWCRECDRVKSREYVRRRKEEGREKKRSSPEKQREYTKRYRSKDLEGRRKAEAESQRRRRKDPVYRLMSSVGRRIRCMLEGRQGSTRHLPYTSSELKSHLEKQFYGDMTWDNYGEYWHIDHIIPVSDFNTSDPESLDFQYCWSLANLRPLTAKENMSKSNKRTYLL